VALVSNTTTTEDEMMGTSRWIQVHPSSAGKITLSTFDGKEFMLQYTAPDEQEPNVEISYLTREDLQGLALVAESLLMIT
jgi:hypothetical protein